MGGVKDADQGGRVVGAVTYVVRMIAKQGQAEAVQELLLTNPRRIEQGEPGNLAFGVHRSTDNPNEFWLYETWVDEAAVQAHESGDAFKQYKETLRPLVEPESVIFGNTVPIKVLGYGPLPTAVGLPSPMRLRACRSHSLTVVSPMVGPIVRRASGASLALSRPWCVALWLGRGAAPRRLHPLGVGSVVPTCCRALETFGWVVAARGTLWSAAGCGRRPLRQRP